MAGAGITVTYFASAFRLLTELSSGYWMEVRSESNRATDVSDVCPGLRGLHLRRGRLEDGGDGLPIGLSGVCPGVQEEQVIEVFLGVCATVVLAGLIYLGYIAVALQMDERRNQKEREKGRRD